MKNKSPISSLAWLTRPILLTLIWLGAMLSGVDAHSQMFIWSTTPTGVNSGRVLRIEYNRSDILTLQPNKYIRIYRYSDDVLLQSLYLGVSNTNQVGRYMDFTLDEFLPYGEEVYVQIDAGAFINYAQDPNEPTPGILDDSWRINVTNGRPDITNMEVISDNLSPVDVQLKITFDEAIVKSDEDGIEFGVYRRSDDFRVTGFSNYDFNILEKSVTISTPDDLLYNLQGDTEYYINLESGFFVQMNSPIRASEGIGQSDPYEWTFTTRVNDGIAPSITSLSPANADQRVDRITENLGFTITFSEPVYINRTTGKVGLYRGGILISDLGATAVMSEDRLSMTCTTPNNDVLLSDTEYYILTDVAAGAFGPPFIDSDENPIPGFTNSNQWSFKTYGPIVKTTYSPSISAVDVSANLTATLTTDAPLQWGSTGNIELRFFDDDQIDKTISNGSGLVSFDGTSISIDLGIIDHETQYYIHIDNGAIVDDFDQNLTLSAKQWNFTTELAPNNTPTDLSLSASAIDENNAVNDAIGTLSSTDADGGDTHIYSLVTNPGSSFNINGNELRASEVFDFEATDSYNIRIETDDQNGGVFEKDFTITINDLVENIDPTDVSLSASAIDENNAVNDVIGTLSSTDADGSDTHIYSLVTNPGSSFNINGNELRASEAFNFEATDSYNIRIETDDQNGGVFEKDFTITINDLAENTILSDNSFEETRTVGYTIGTFSTPDAVVGETYTYSLVAGAGDTDNGNFSMVGAQLRVAAPFDFEAQSSHAIRVQTSAGNGSTFPETFTIQIEDDPEVPTDISLDVSDIDENNDIDQVIGTLNTTDPDNGDTHSYSILTIGGSTDHNAFAIDGSNLIADEIFDFESQNSYIIRIRTQDALGDSYNEDFTITINDVVENNTPTNISLSANMLDENNSVNDVIGTLSTTDTDAGDTHIYSLITNPGSSFNINNNELRASEAFDFESTDSYDIRIETDDQNGGVFEKDFTITINDVVENSVPTDITLSVSAIDEGNALNDVIGSFSTTDADGGDTHSYSLVTNPSNSFEISGNQLKAIKFFDFETTESYAIRIETDDLNGGTYEKDFTISVNDLGPVITAFAPVHEATGVALDGDLVITFDEPIQGGTGTVAVASSNGFYRLSGNPQDGTDQFTVSGSTLTIHLGAEDKSGEFLPITSYYVYLFDAAVLDANGVPFDQGWGNSQATWRFTTGKAPSNIQLSAIADKVISDPDFDVAVSTDNGDNVFTYEIVSGPATIFNRTISLTGGTGTVTVQVSQAGSFRFLAESVTTTFEVTDAPDVTAPQIVSLTPVDGGTDVPLDGELIILFDEPIVAGTADIEVKLLSPVIYALSGNPTDNADIFEISGSTLTIKMANANNFGFTNAKEYFVTINNGAVKDPAGNSFQSNITGTTDWNFTTSKAPSNIIIDEITDKETDDGTFMVTASTDNIQTGLVYEILSGPATINGQTITLTGATGTVTVQVSQIETVTYLAESVSTTFEVTEAPDVTAPQIASLTPVDGSIDIPLDGDLVVLFDEPIIAGTTDILVRAVGGGSYALSGNATDNSDIFEITGNTLTIKMANANNFGFFNNQAYYVTINSGAVKDLAGNNLIAGINNTTDWNFTTERLTVTWSEGAWSNGSGPNSTKDAVINDDFSTDLNGGLTAADLTINAGITFTVDGEKTLTVNGDLTNDGSLIVESGSSLISYEAKDISGNNIIIKRNTRYSDGKYSFVGTPMTQDASIIGSDLGGYVYKYNEAIAFGADGINRWIGASNDQLIPGKGYTQANQQEIVFSGIPNRGTIVYSGTYTEDTDDANEGWNLVSNPYAAALNISDFLALNTAITGAVYIWDDNGSNSQRGSNADYITANGSMATSTQNYDDADRYNNHVGTTQAFFVKLNNSVNTDITFTEAMRRSNKNFDDNFFRKTVLPIARINLKDQKGLFKQTVIGLSEDATTMELNRTFDAQAFNAIADFGLFTMKAGRSLTLNGMPFDWNEIQLQLNVAEAGTYEISMELEGFAQAIYLRDHLTNDLIDITNDSYSFFAQPGIDTERFQLVSSPSKVLGIDKKEIFVYAIGKTIHIKQSSASKEEYQLFNMKGKRLLTTAVMIDSVIDVSHLPAGIYLVFDGHRSHKIILE